MDEGAIDFESLSYLIVARESVLAHEDSYKVGSVESEGVDRKIEGRCADNTESRGDFG